MSYCTENNAPPTAPPNKVWRYLEAPSLLNTLDHPPKDPYLPVNPSHDNVSITPFTES